MTVNFMRAGSTTCPLWTRWQCSPSMKPARRTVGTTSVKPITVLGTPAAAQPWPSKVRYTKSLAFFLLLWSGFFLSSVLSSKTKRPVNGNLLAILKLAFMTCPFLCSCTVIRSHQALNDSDSNIFFPCLRQLLSLFIFFSSGSTSCFHPEAFSNRSP